jgi:glutaredoxin-related protein
MYNPWRYRRKYSRYNPDEIEECRCDEIRCNPCGACGEDERINPSVGFHEGAITHYDDTAGVSFRDGDVIELEDIEDDFDEFDDFDNIPYRYNPEFLAGDDYGFCEACKSTLDDLAEMYRSGDMPDTDDIEAPVVFMSDNNMFCGGDECINS